MGVLLAICCIFSEQLFLESTSGRLLLELLHGRVSVSLLKQTEKIHLSRGIYQIIKSTLLDFILISNSDIKVEYIIVIAISQITNVISSYY